MVLGCWVGEPLPVSLFFLLLFSVLLFIPCERISRLGCGWVFSPMLLDPFPFLPSSRFSFLGVDACRPGIGSNRFSCNK